MRKRIWALGAAVLLAAPVQAETLTLTAMGDSLTQGYGLQQHEGFVPVLQEWLTARGHDVVVINAGVSGDTTAGGLSRIDWTLADAPDALIVALGGNDLLRGIDPAASRANLDGVAKAAAEAGVPTLIAGLPAPGNYGAEFQRDFETMFRDAAEARGALHYPNFLQPMQDKQDAGQSFADLMQNDRIHPNAEGVRLIVEAMGPAVEDLLARAREAGAGG